MTRKSNVQIGSEWEDEVFDFFNKDLGFENVDGGLDFRPGKQIDVVAGIHNVLFVIECKTKHELGKSTKLASEITDLKKDSIIIESKLKTIRNGKYARYNHFVFLIATKDIVWNSSDLDEIRNRDASVERTWFGKLDESQIEYYKMIGRKVSTEIEKFTFLSDYSIKFPKTDALELPAFKNNIHGINVYNFVATPQKIMKYVSVARRESRQYEYYQRMINGDRCRDIIDYIDEPNALFHSGKVIPGNIVLATRPNTRITDEKTVSNFSDSDLVKIKLPTQYGAFWIVDGQHRLYAYCMNSKINPRRSTKKDDRITITLLDGTSLPQQQKIFVDINDKQKGIDKSYLIDIEGDADPNSYMGRLSNLIKEINSLKKIKSNKTDYSNPLFSEIKIPSQGVSRKKFDLVSIYDALDTAGVAHKKLKMRIKGVELQNPFFSNSSLLPRYLALYFSSVKNIFEGKLSPKTQTAYSYEYFMNGRMKKGFISIMANIFTRIIYASNYNSSITILPDEKIFIKYLIPVYEHLAKIKKHEDFASFINTIGQGNRDATVRRICVVIKESGYPEFNFDDLDDDFNQIVLRAKALETRLKKLLNKTMIKEFGDDWCKGTNENAMPEEMFEDSKRKAKKDLQRNPMIIESGELFMHLDYGKLKTLFEKHWKIFSKIFITNSGFSDKAQFFTAFDLIVDYRNTESHNMEEQEVREYLKTQHQKKFAENFLKVFDSLVE